MTSFSPFEEGSLGESLSVVVSGDEESDDFLRFIGSISLSWLFVIEVDDAPDAVSLGVDVGDTEDDDDDDECSNDDDCCCDCDCCSVFGSVSVLLE